jgi:uncharacterized membrane protein
MDANVAALVVLIVTGVAMWIPFLVYVAWVVPLVFFLMEKESTYVKYYACVAMIIAIISAVFETLFRIIIWIITLRTYASYLGWLTGGWGLLTFFYGLLAIIGVALSVLVLYHVIVAYDYKQVELPLIGQIATKISEKLGTINIHQQNTNVPPYTPPNAPPPGAPPYTPTNAPPPNVPPYTPTNVPPNAPASVPPNAPPDNAENPIFCSECGAKNIRGTKFCSGCGKPLTQP